MKLHKLVGLWLKELSPKQECYKHLYLANKDILLRRTQRSSIVVAFYEIEGYRIWQMSLDGTTEVIHLRADDPEFFKKLENHIYSCAKIRTYVS